MEEEFKDPCPKCNVDNEGKKPGFIFEPQGGYTSPGPALGPGIPGPEFYPEGKWAECDICGGKGYLSEDREAQ